MGSAAERIAASQAATRTGFVAFADKSAHLVDTLREQLAAGPNPGELNAEQAAVVEAEASSLATAIQTAVDALPTA